MQELNGTKTLVGTVTLTRILIDQNYTLRIIPYSSTNSCVCLDCSCVLIQSDLFTLPQQIQPVQTSLNSAKAISTKHSNDHLLRIQIVDDRTAPTTENSTMFLLIVFFCILSLTFISAALIILLCRSANKPNALILVKSTKIGQEEKPFLTPVYHTTQTILILNAEPSKTKLIEMLANMLEGSHYKVVSMEREQNAIEKNLQSWCQNVLIKANKVSHQSSHMHQ